MRPLLISHSDSGGGAARAAYRLHTALRRAGIDSALWVETKHTRDETVTRLGGPMRLVRRPIALRMANRLARYDRAGDAMRSHGFIPSGLPRRVRASGADVVNLHWINQETISVAEIGRLSKPVILTLHDMWAFTGSEHYTGDGDGARWRGGYDGSAALRFDLARWTWRRKRRHWRPMHVVAPSAWLAGCARASALMHDWPVHVIPNPLDTDVYRPLDRAAARRTLGLPQNDTILLFGAVDGLADRRKGGDLLLSALAALGPLPGVSLAVFGQSAPPEPPPLPQPVHWLGRIDDDATLARAYSAADVMIVPSRMENLPQTATEAQACGAPVVAFDVAGMPDAVTDGETGLLAERESPEALAAAILALVGDAARRKAMGAAARERAVRLWSPGVVARAYGDVYAEAMAG